MLTKQLGSLIYFVSKNAQTSVSKVACKTASKNENK
jgi:hypothetical protein